MAEGQRSYSTGEEIASAIIHGIGWLLGIAMLALLIVFASLEGDAWYIVSCTIYGVTIVMMYTSSTMYHSLTNARAKRVFKILDHSSIYFLIAGTYTPFALTLLRGLWGWTIFGIVWTLAAAGTVFKTLFVGRFKPVSVGSSIGARSSGLRLSR